jgi:hypothetical protein
VGRALLERVVGGLVAGVVEQVAALAAAASESVSGQVGVGHGVREEEHRGEGALGSKGHGADEQGIRRRPAARRSAAAGGQAFALLSDTKEISGLAVANSVYSICFVRSSSYFLFLFSRRGGPGRLCGRCP